MDRFSGLISWDASQIIFGNASQNPNLKKKAIASAPSFGLIFYATRTGHSGIGGPLFLELAPEDRAMIRKIKHIRKASPVSFYQVPQTNSFKVESAAASDKPKSMFVIDFKALREVVPNFLSSVTQPNRQDFFYLGTKTFGINLIVRLFFAIQGVWKGDLPLLRAVLATAWYQLQDAVFTVFGQTYMKFLSKMTGVVRIGSISIGDFVFVFFQLSFFEFLNRLILGPLGENPLVTTWAGIGLVFLNNLQGLISGGVFVPAINKMRRTGVISHSTMMHFYQLGSLSLHFGLFASFGYQKIYAILTIAWMIFGWGGYLVFSMPLFRDPELKPISEPAIEKAALVCLKKIDS